MPKTVQWNIIIIIIVVVVVDDDTYYWVYLSSDHPFQVYYKVQQVLLQSAPGITKCDKHSLCSLFEPGEQPGTKKFSTLRVNLIKLLQG